MRAMLSWLAIIFAGLMLGGGGAVASLRSSGLGHDAQIGPWSTGHEIGTAAADVRTRAVVGLRGLLALPGSEARYFTARTDSSGANLLGECTYLISGPDLPGRWWSLTLYDHEGWLMPNRWQAHSVGGRPDARVGEGSWQVRVAPEPSARADNWIASPPAESFELTLRVYRPRGALDDARVLPTIVRQGCRS